MEQNLPLVAKKAWHIMKIAFFMLKKGICKKKILLDLNMMMKRGKLVRKALTNLMFQLHHHHHHSSATRGGVSGPNHLDNSIDGPREYEFSCSSTPLYRQYFPSKRKNHKKNQMPSIDYEDIDNINLEGVNKVLEMMLTNNVKVGLGFGRSPMVRPLRITDSPFVGQNMEEDCYVDQAADDFIRRFYSQLKEQS